MSTAKSSFQGVLVPVLTPFDSALKPDSQRFSAFCLWLLEQGAAGLAVFGTTSEANSLGIAERIGLLENLLEAGVPAAKLMPGTGTCALTDSIQLTRHAIEAGCGGVLTLPPFYYKGVSEDGLFASYSEIIQGVGDDRLRLYLYHIPQMTAVPISLSLLERLQKAYPEVVMGIKDSAGDWDNTQALLREFPDLAIYPSAESRLLETMAQGGAGCISATANINVAAIASLIANWQAPDAAEKQAAVTAVRKTFEAYPLIPALKETVAHYSGTPSWSRLRPPLMAMDAAQKASLLETLKGLDFSFEFGKN